jgi:hypothetical protein
VQHHESYQGRPITLTTEQTVDGSWAWKAEVPEEVRGSAISSPADGTYRTEDEALSAARSAAAEAVDRARTSRGKP